MPHLTQASRTEKHKAYLLPWTLWGLLAVVLMTVIGWGILSLSQEGSFTAALHASRTTRLPVYGTVPDFTLIDQRERPMRQVDLLGKLWVTSLLFTRCPDECPLMSAEMARLQVEFADTPDFHLLSISVDPHHDTPAVLSKYASRFHADPERWRFVTGEKNQIYMLVREGFRLGIVESRAPSEPLPAQKSHFEPYQSSLSRALVEYTPSKSDWLLHLSAWADSLAPSPAFAHHTAAKSPLHSSRFVLIDRRAQIRGYYDSQDDTALQRLRQHLRVLSQDG